MASPTSLRRRHDRPMVIRTCPESGNLGAPSTFWTLRRISNPVTYHFALGQVACRPTRRRLAFGRGSPRKLLATRCPEDQCLTPTVEGDPKNGHHWDSL